MALNTKAVPYPLKRDSIASARLNFNHFVMKSLIGYLLHPKIPINEENILVADLGTGTGIWACEMAAAAPNITIDAFDISSDQFPPQWVCPKNISWQVHDCFTPFPEEYLGKFDIVHVRFLICVLNDDSAPKALENFVTLLKPGGYIQWFEPMMEATAVKAPEGMSTPACDRLVEFGKRPRPHSSFNWAHSLPKIFETHNLDVVAEEKYSLPDHYLPVNAQSILMALSEGLYDNPDLEVFLEEAAKEHKKGALIDVVWTIIVGRKPLQTDA